MKSQRFNEIDSKMWEIACVAEGKPGGDFRSGLKFNKADTLATDEELSYFGKAYGLYLHTCGDCGKSFFSWQQYLN